MAYEEALAMAIGTGLAVRFCCQLIATLFGAFTAMKDAA